MSLRLCNIGRLGTIYNHLRNVFLLHRSSIFPPAPVVYLSVYLILSIIIEGMRFSSTACTIWLGTVFGDSLPSYPATMATLEICTCIRINRNNTINTLQGTKAYSNAGSSHNADSHDTTVR